MSAARPALDAAQLALLSRLSARGVRLAARGDRLAVTPAGALTEADIVELRQHKQSIIDALVATPIDRQRRVAIVARSRATILDAARRIDAGVHYWTEPASDTPRPVRPWTCRCGKVSVGGECWNCGQPRAAGWRPAPALLPGGRPPGDPDTAAIVEGCEEGRGGLRAHLDAGGRLDDAAPLPPGWTS